MIVTIPSNLSDAELVAAVGRLAEGERTSTAALVLHLGEFQARRLYEGQGYPSLFKYCVSALHLSEDAAYNRIEAARAAREFPVIIELLASGALRLTTLRMVARHLTAENHHTLLPAAAGKSKPQVQGLLAAWFPQEDVRERIRKVPVRARSVVTREPETGGLEVPSPICPVPALPSTAPPSDGPAAAPPIAAPPIAAPPVVVPPVVVAPPARGGHVIRPLAPSRYEIRFTASEETREKLLRAQDLLSHALPTGDLATVIDRALTLLVADLERKKVAATGHPRPGSAEPRSTRTVPAAVRRAVWKRDGGRCVFVSSGGHLCGETRFVEFHHRRPWAAGGSATIENIQLRCRAHNGHEVDRFFGPGVRRTGPAAARAVSGTPVARDERNRSGTTLRAGP